MVGLFEDVNLCAVHKVCMPSQYREDHMPDGIDMEHPHCWPIGNTYPLDCNTVVMLISFVMIKNEQQKSKTCVINVNDLREVCVPNHIA